MAAIAILVAWAHRSDLDAPSGVALTWIADAHQLGPVGYRDPAGAISPDGKWIAYSEGRMLRVRPIGGGPSVDLPAGDAQIRNLSWNPDSRTILTDGFVTGSGWGMYDAGSRTRQPLWEKREEVRQATWSPTGRLIAAIVNGRDGQEVVALAPDGRSTHVVTSARRISFPTWTPRGEIACITTIDGRARVTIPCGGGAIRIDQIGRASCRERV